MFNFFKKKNKQKEEFEYSFVWFKKMVNKDKTIYTQPFRTKVKAVSHEEAKKKLTEFALRKMELVIISEDDFEETDLSKAQEQFDEVYRKMDDLFKKFRN